MAILAAAALCTWRFGPWYGDSDSNSSTPETLKALNTCESCCNGLASNCDLPLNQVTFAMVHNAMSSRDDLFAGYNNLEPLEEAMVAGYRGLMLDSCNCAGSVEEEVTSFFNGEGDATVRYEILYLHLSLEKMVNALSCLVRLCRGHVTISLNSPKVLLTIVYSSGFQF